MAEQRLEMLAGAGVLIVALGFALFAGQGLGMQGQSGSYPLKASFRSVQGIAVGADVKLAGVKVGTITSMVLNPQTFMADTMISVDKSIQLPTDSAIIISQDGLLGGAYVEILPGGMPDNLAPGDEIEDTQGSVSLINLLMKFVGGGSDSGDKADAPAEAPAETAPATEPAPATTSP